MKRDKADSSKDEGQNPTTPLVNGINHHPRAEDPVSQILQNIDAALYMCDADGTIIMYNEAAARLWGRRPRIGEDKWCGSWKLFSLDGSPIELSECPMAVTLKEGRPVQGREIIVERP